MFVWIHISGGTSILAYSFDTRADADAFRTKYADDEDPERGYRDVDDIPILPFSFDERDNHETDTWVLVEGTSIVMVDGEAPSHVRIP